MFPPTTAFRPKKRSLRELVRDAVDTAVEFATLGEASASARSAPAPSGNGPAAQPGVHLAGPRAGNPHLMPCPRPNRPGLGGLAARGGRAAALSAASVHAP